MERPFLVKLATDIQDPRGPIPPDVEALCWLFAERMGLIDGIGGHEWRGRVADGAVSEDALAALRSLGRDAGEA